MARVRLVVKKMGALNWNFLGHNFIFFGLSSTLLFSFFVLYHHCAFFGAGSLEVWLP